MRTVEEVAKQIFKALGIPLEMKNIDKAYHDRMMIVNILTKWRDELIGRKNIL